MVMVKSNYKGKCSKCPTVIQEGDECAVEKGKPRLCKKCAPPEASVKKPWSGRPPENPWDGYMKAMVTAYRPKPGASVEDIDREVSGFAAVVDAVMRARVKRGIK